MALYTAKREGRGRYRVYEESMSKDAQERRLVELDLHAALAEQAFTLHLPAYRRSGDARRRRP